MGIREPQLHIGTSGWHYNHWGKKFYPQGLPASRMLSFYAQRFGTVELNNTFYKLPTVSGLSAWREATPRGFLFAVKGSRFLTHNKKLNDPENALRNFLPRVEEGLGRKLGPILFQLPPRWRVNPERLENFLAMLPRRHRYSFEFRDPSWHTQPVYDLLRRYRAAFCIFDIGGFQSPLEITADWTYVRLHGPGAKYQGSYSLRDLRAWLRRVCGEWRRLKHVYFYFDNDQEAFAARNALQLKKLAAEAGLAARTVPRAA